MQIKHVLTNSANSAAADFFLLLPFLPQAQISCKLFQSKAANLILQLRERYETPEPLVGIIAGVIEGGDLQLEKCRPKKKKVDKSKVIHSINSRGLEGS